MDPYEDEFGTIDAVVPWVIGGFLVLFLCVLVLMAVSVARNRRVLRQSGIDPATVGSQLAVRLLRGQSTVLPTGSGSAPGSASNRLVELTDLRDRGLITPAEYQARREQIIGGI